MLIVADSSALIALATCQALDVLLRVYAEVRVPQAVYAEVTAPEKPQAALLAAFLASRVETVDLKRWVISASGLGQGEYRSDGVVQTIGGRCTLNR